MAQEQTTPNTAKEETVVMEVPSGSVAQGLAPEDTRGDISAATIARMMGLATVTETKLVEGKVDLLTTKLNTIQVKLEKVLSVLGNVPTGADLERIDVQVGALRQLIRDVMAKEIGEHESAEQADAAKKPGSRIQSTS